MGLAAFNKMRKRRAEKAKETEKKELINKLEKEQREKALALVLKEKDMQGEPSNTNSTVKPTETEGSENEYEIRFESLKVEELKELAKEKGVEGYEKMKKVELLEALKG